jgi:hypothetical protein
MVPANPAETGALLSRRQHDKSGSIQGKRQTNCRIAETRAGVLSW